MSKDTTPAVVLVSGPQGEEYEQVQSPTFFFAQMQLLTGERGQSLDREELLVYALHCRGYSEGGNDGFCSTMGAQAARKRLGITEKPFLNAQKMLAQFYRLTLELPRPDRRFPRTCIADVRHPYAQGTVATTKPFDHDGHRYSSLPGDELVKLPWSLIDGLDDGSVPRLSELETKEAIRLLLAMYEKAGLDGLMPVREVWIEDGRLCVSKGTLERLGLGALAIDTLDAVIQELLDSGLVLPAGVRRAGRAVTTVRLAHVIAEVSSDRRSAGDNKGEKDASLAPPIGTPEPLNPCSPEQVRPSTYAPQQAEPIYDRSSEPQLHRTPEPSLC